MRLHRVRARAPGLLSMRAVRRGAGPGLAGALVVLAGCGGETMDAAGQGGGLTSQHHAYRVAIVAEGLEHPWGLAFLPDGELLVTERPGRLRRVRGGVLDPDPIEGVPEVRAGGQGGLLDVAVHPGYATNRLVYLSFSKPGPEGGTTAVVRGRLEGHGLQDVEEVLEARAWSSSGVHYGSRLVFDGQGHLFVTVGERGRMQNAQDLSTHAGKILRVHDDGTVPTGNPFVGRPGALPEIWALGVRSPQGLVLGPDGRLWESEHGPRGGDEINVIERGANYGWPVITYGINYDGSEITDDTARCISYNGQTAPGSGFWFDTDGGLGGRGWNDVVIRGYKRSGTDVDGVPQALVVADVVAHEVGVAGHGASDDGLVREGRLRRPGHRGTGRR
mgnify:CR=1 FL=1